MLNVKLLLFFSPINLYKTCFRHLGYWFIFLSLWRDTPDEFIRLYAVNSPVVLIMEIIFFCSCNNASKIFTGLRLLLFYFFFYKNGKPGELNNTESTVMKHNNLQKMFLPNNSNLWSLHRQLNIKVILFLQGGKQHPLLEQDTHHLHPSLTLYSTNTHPMRFASLCWFKFYEML